MKTLWLYLHFPQLQMDTLFSQADSELPVVILDNRKNSVLQLNQPARDAGIQIGMGLGTCAALAQDVNVLPYRADTEHGTLNELAESLYIVTSDISLYPPNGLLLRIHHMLNLYGGLRPYWHAVKLKLDHHRLNYHFATGHSPYAARILAKEAWNTVTDSSEKLNQALRACDLVLTDLPEKIIQKLDRVGIRKIADLLALPLKELAKRFDIEVVTYLGRLTGEFHHPVRYFQPQDHFHRYLELLFDIQHVETLEHPLKHMLKSLEQFLKIRDQVTRQLNLTLHQRDADDLAITIGSAQGEYLTQHWLNLSKLHFESISLGAPVYAITLSTGDTEQHQRDANGLFDQRRGALSYFQLISLLQAKMGKQAVQQPRVQDDYRPEIVNTYHAPECESHTTLPRLQVLRPSFLLPVPQQLREQVTLVSGPERISTGWWDNHHVTRDYFIARSETGSWYWVYRTPQQKWFLHGIFS